MRWKIKTVVGEVSIEAEIPLTDRSTISMEENGNAGKTIKMIESLSEKALEVSIRFEKEKRMVEKETINLRGKTIQKKSGQNMRRNFRNLYLVQKTI